jgi:hypothetical protein
MFPILTRASRLNGFRVDALRRLLLMTKSIDDKVLIVKNVYYPYDVPYTSQAYITQNSIGTILPMDKLEQTSHPNCYRVRLEYVTPNEQESDGGTYHNA